MQNVALIKVQTALASRTEILGFTMAISICPNRIFKYLMESLNTFNNSCPPNVKEPYHHLTMNSPHKHLQPQVGYSARVMNTGVGSSNTWKGHLKTTKDPPTQNTLPLILYRVCLSKDPLNTQNSDLVCTGHSIPLPPFTQGTTPVVLCPLLQPFLAHPPDASSSQSHPSPDLTSLPSLCFLLCSLSFDLLSASLERTGARFHQRALSIACEFDSLQMRL